MERKEERAPRASVGCDTVGQIDGGSAHAATTSQPENDALPHGKRRGSDDRQECKDDQGEDLSFQPMRRKRQKKRSLSSEPTHGRDEKRKGEPEETTTGEDAGEATAASAPPARVADALMVGHGFRKRTAIAPDGTTIEAQLICLDVLSEVRLRTGDGLLYYARRFDRAWCERRAPPPGEGFHDHLDVAYLRVPPWWDAPRADAAPARWYNRVAHRGVRLDRQHLLVHLADRGVVRVDDEMARVMVASYRDPRSRRRAVARPHPERTPWRRVCPGRSLALYRFGLNSDMLPDGERAHLGGVDAVVFLTGERATRESFRLALPEIHVRPEEWERVAQRPRELGMGRTQLDESGIAPWTACAAACRMQAAADHLLDLLDRVGMLGEVRRHSYASDACGGDDGGDGRPEEEKEDYEQENGNEDEEEEFDGDEQPTQRDLDFIDDGDIESDDNDDDDYDDDAQR